MTESHLLLAELTREAEERFLSSLFFNVADGLNVACDHGLTTDSFWFFEHRWLFNTICEATQQGRRLTVDDVLELNRMAERPFDEQEHDHPLLEVLHADTSPTSLNSSAAIIADMHRRRERLEALELEAQGILEGEPV